MGMTRNHSMNVDSCWIDVESGKLMEHIEGLRCILYHFGCRKILRPRSMIVIPTHSDDRRKPTKFFEYAFIANVAGMDNEV